MLGREPAQVAEGDHLHIVAREGERRGLRGSAARGRGRPRARGDMREHVLLLDAPVVAATGNRRGIEAVGRDEALDGAFLKGAEARGMVQLKGHRSVGGMRASIYNAMPLEGVQTLVAYMKEFEASHG